MEGALRDVIVESHMQLIDCIREWRIFEKVDIGLRKNSPLKKTDFLRAKPVFFHREESPLVAWGFWWHVIETLEI